MITNVLTKLIASSVTEAVKKSLYYNEWFVTTRSILFSLQGPWGVLYIFIFPFVACLIFSSMYHICSPNLRDLQACFLIHRVPQFSRYRLIFWNGEFLFSVVWTLQFAMYNLMCSWIFISCQPFWHTSEGVWASFCQLNSLRKRCYEYL